MCEVFGLALARARALALAAAQVRLLGEDVVDSDCVEVSPVNEDRAKPSFLKLGLR